MLTRVIPLIAIAALLAPLPAFAQSEEDVYSRIESLQGDADGFFELFSAIQDATINGDPASIADYAVYPLAINTDGETYNVLDRQELYDNFDTLISPAVVDALSTQDVADLFVNQDGVSIGQGAMWITNTCLDEACTQTQWGISAINN